MRDRQEQQGGDQAANLQAGRDIVVHQGLSATDLAAITDTFRANLAEMRGVAKEVFAERAEHLLNQVLERLANENPESVRHAADPDFQLALIDAATAHGRTGDPDLEQLLVNILVDRVAQPSRSLAHIILGEALTVAPKLTPAHIDALTVSWFMRNLQFQCAEPGEVAAVFAVHALPFLTDWPISASAYQHLQYLGCGQVSPLQADFDPLMPHKFPALFARHGEAQVATALQEIHLALQATGNEQLQRFADSWNNSDSKSFIPTALGIVIAHANHRRKTGQQLDLSIWVH